ncbi:hypothetical protein EJB05_04280, partial [Eragrostis curvula]
MPASGGGDGYALDFAGFVALMEREGGQEDDLRRAFEVFNAVESAGRITARGLQRVLAQLGDQRSVADCEAMIRAYDKNTIIHWHYMKLRSIRPYESPPPPNLKGLLKIGAAVPNLQEAPEP